MVERITEAQARARFKLWFFRDVDDEARLKLFDLFGHQAIAMRHVLAALSTEPGEAEGTAPQDRLSRDQDIVLEALNEYDAWMMDDDYDAMAVLHRIMARMRSRVLPAAPTSEGSHHGS